jgi:hypothetical protein
MKKFLFFQLFLNSIAILAELGEIISKKKKTI